MRDRRSGVALPGAAGAPGDSEAGLLEAARATPRRSSIIKEKTGPPGSLVLLLVQRSIKSKFKFYIIVLDVFEGEYVHTPITKINLIDEKAGTGALSDLNLCRPCACCHSRLFPEMRVQRKERDKARLGQVVECGGDSEGEISLALVALFAFSPYRPEENKQNGIEKRNKEKTQETNAHTMKTEPIIYKQKTRYWLWFNFWSHQSMTLQGQNTDCEVHIPEAYDGADMEVESKKPSETRRDREAGHVLVSDSKDPEVGKLTSVSSL
ncbi:hypothetical protein STEG23_015889 [Scotinomys teguina]